MGYRVIPIILSCLALAAHFLRGQGLLAALLCLLAPFLLWHRRRWVVRVIQAGLVLGAGVWVVTALELWAARRAHGDPWVRMALILGGVALFTLISALLLESKKVKERYPAGPAAASDRGQGG